MYPMFLARRHGWRLPMMVLLLLLGLGLADARAQDVASLLPVEQAYRLSADAGTPGMIHLHWAIAPDYYLYRGRMKFSAQSGVSLGEPQLPPGRRHHDEYLGEVETYHHDIDVVIPYRASAGTQRLTLQVGYQGCHATEPKVCYPPHEQTLDLPLPAGAAAAAVAATEFATRDPGITSPTSSAVSLGAALNRLGTRPAAAQPGIDRAALPAQEAFRFEAVAPDAHRLLLRWTLPPGYYLYRDRTTLQLQGAPGLKLAAPQWPPGIAHRDEHFGAVTVYFGQVDVPVAVVGHTAGVTTLHLRAQFQGCQQNGICYPVMTRTLAIPVGRGTAAVAAAPAGGTTISTPPRRFGLLAALGLALLGGLVLNLMPCVLPVLSLKAVGVLESSESPQRRRRHALFYSAGVLVSFVVLGLVAVTLGHAWGAHLQQPLVVGVLALVMLAVGLSLSGLVQWGLGLGRGGAALMRQPGATGDFFTGVLAVVVASPCTAPFMGAALAFAFAAPTAAALGVFVLLGVGLALPILALAYVPGAARLLPRPGRWMETLKQVLAFPMYLTAVWLAWVLARQRGADAVGLLLVAAVLLAMTLWWFERSRQRGAAARALVAVVALAMLVPLALLARIPAPASGAVASGAVAYSAASLEQLRRSDTPVFVDITADWCVTCKANEHAVLHTQAFRSLLEQTGAVYMKGDWTDPNPAIESFLQRFHSPGVPLYVVFPRGGGAGRVLSTVLTPGRVRQALTEAARRP